MKMISRVASLAAGLVMLSVASMKIPRAHTPSDYLVVAVLVAAGVIYLFRCLPEKKDDCDE